VTFFLGTEKYSNRFAYTAAFSLEYTEHPIDQNAPVELQNSMIGVIASAILIFLLVSQDDSSRNNRPPSGV